MYSISYMQIIELRWMKLQSLQLCRLRFTLHDMYCRMSLMVAIPQSQVVDNIPDVVTLVVTWKLKNIWLGVRRFQSHARVEVDG